MGVLDVHLAFFWLFQLLLILIKDIVTSVLKKNQITMKIENMTHIWMRHVHDEFWAARNGKKVIF